MEARKPDVVAWSLRHPFLAIALTSAGMLLVGVMVMVGVVWLLK